MKLTEKQSGLLVFYDYKKWKYKLLYFLLILFMILIVIVTVFPPIWLLVSSFKEVDELYALPYSFFPNVFSMQKVIDVWTFQGIGRNYLNSLIVVIGSVISAVLFNGLLAYVISILKPKGSKLIFSVILASLMIPPILNMAPLLNNIANIGLMNSFVPLWLLFGASPFFFVMFKTYFDQLPKELFDAAKIDGASEIAMFRYLIIPLSKPIIGVVSIFTINAAWSDFLLPYLVLLQPDKQTVMVKLYALFGTIGKTQYFQIDEMLMAITFSIVPPIILFILFQKQITSNVTTSGIKE
jgi:multiple sugar transport system permease protein